MTKIYSRQSARVIPVERKDSQNRSYNKGKGPRDFHSDSVQLGVKETPEDQVYGFLKDRIAYHLGNRLDDGKIELGYSPSIPGFPAMSSESVAFSILSFATSYFDRFKRNHNVVGQEARVKLATFIGAAVNEATEEVLGLVWEPPGFVHRDMIDSIQRFRERTSAILSDFVEHGPL
jgi:hypothetical protein